MKAHTLLTAIALLASSSAAISSETTTTKCHTNGSYLVVESPQENNIIIARKTSPEKPAACTTEHLPGDYLVAPDEKNPRQTRYYAGLRNNLLVLEVGSADLRDVEVHDLSANKVLFQKTLVRNGACPLFASCLDQSSDLYFRDGSIFIRYRSDEKPTQANCPEIKDILKYKMTPFILETLQINEQTHAFTKTATCSRDAPL